MKRKFASLFLTLGMGLLLTACSNKTQSQVSDAAAAPAETKAEAASSEQSGNAESSLDALNKKTITMLISVSPGSSTDNIAQQWIKSASKFVNANFVCEYKEGGSTAVAQNYMVNQPADGLLIQMATVTNEVTMAFNDFDGSKYQDLAILAEDRCMIMVPAKSQFQTFEELLQYAKENPGKLNYGAASAKGVHSLFFDQLCSLADIKMTYVPYTSTVEVVTGALGGNTDVIAVISSANTYVESGDMRVLAVGSKERSELYPDIPTVFETEGLEFEKFGGVSYVGGKSIMCRAGIPEEMANAYYELCDKIAEDEDWISFCKNQGLSTSEYCTGEKANELSHNRLEIYKQLVDQFYE